MSKTHHIIVSVSETVPPVRRFFSLFLSISFYSEIVSKMPTFCFKTSNERLFLSLVPMIMNRFFPTDFSGCLCPFKDIRISPGSSYFLGKIDFHCKSQHFFLYFFCLSLSFNFFVCFNIWLIDANFFPPASFSSSRSFYIWRKQFNHHFWGGLCVSLQTMTLNIWLIDVNMSLPPAFLPLPSDFQNDISQYKCVHIQCVYPHICRVMYVG